MPAPTLTSSTPAGGANSVAKNVALQLTFSTPLLASTVVPAVFPLTNQLTNTLLPTTVSLSPSGLVVTIVPHAHLMPNAGHRLRVIGADISAAACLKASDSSNLAVTITILFQTVDQLEATTDDKTEGQSDLEGDAQLPDDLTFKAVSGAPLSLISTSPSHRSFKMNPSLAQVSFRFNADLDPSTVTGNVQIRQFAFYEEEAYRAREIDLLNTEGLRHYFMAETGHYTGLPQGFLDPMQFRDRTGYPTVAGPYLNVLLEADYPWPDNMCLEITIGADIADVDGNPLGDDFVWFACTYPYPDWVAVMSVRHETGHDVSGLVSDDFVGLRIWRATIDLLHESDWVFSKDHPNSPMKQYVRYKSAIDIWDDMLAAKALAAGTTKRLGDLQITVTPAAGGARPMKVKRLEELILELERNLWYWKTQTPKIGIKSIMDALEPGRGFFRNRLWRAELPMDPGSGDDLSANTEIQRRQGSWGGLDPERNL